MKKHGTNVLMTYILMKCTQVSSPVLEYTIKGKGPVRSQVSVFVKVIKRVSEPSSLRQTDPGSLRETFGDLRFESQSDEK